MDPLPMAPESCSLDESGLAAQRERYRQVGAGASAVERADRRIAIRLDDTVRTDVIEQLIAVERDCCPFFTLDWDPPSRLFSASVAEPRHEPALDAIAYALGVGQ